MPGGCWRKKINAMISLLTLPYQSKITMTGELIIESCLIQIRNSVNTAGRINEKSVNFSISSRSRSISPLKEKIYSLQPEKKMFMNGYMT